MLSMFGDSSANCAPHRQGWRVTPASEKESLDFALPSARCAGVDGASC
ncbi:hypothetical protein A2U01_0082343 [Trifolium medium]|uniref:Uncharacterized protein n=1 Tax=Trifolium medium TaxID=97028 RepID=A0A392TKW7_9FABA|nr:hypothetical protein [Trifolium medium]